MSTTCKTCGDTVTWCPELLDELVATWAARSEWHKSTAWAYRENLLALDAEDEA